MHRLLALALALAAASAAASETQLLDLETVRSSLHSLLEQGKLFSDDTMAGVPQAYSGIVQQCLKEMESSFSGAKSVAEVYTKNQVTDLEVTRSLLAAVRQHGGSSSSSSELGAAAMSLLNGPSRKLLQPYLSSAAGMAKFTEMSSRLLSIIGSLNGLLGTATEDFRTQVRQHVGKLSGYAKEFVADLADTLDSLEVAEVEEDGAQMSLDLSKVDSYKAALDRAINKQVVKFIVSNMANRAAAVKILDEMLTRDYSSDDLPKILTAIRNSLN